ncbi:hypothetical protein [Clostridium perfringens]|uniref:hypothetical protein n=1 Tax=Clostridium perfringens TaxID=1502 RepID=UPI0039EBA05C
MGLKRVGQFEWERIEYLIKETIKKIGIEEKVGVRVPRDFNEFKLEFVGLSRASASKIVEEFNFDLSNYDMSINSYLDEFYYDCDFFDGKMVLDISIKEDKYKIINRLYKEIYFLDVEVIGESCDEYYFGVVLK